MGNRKKPDELRVLLGNTRKDRMNPLQPKLKRAKPDCPGTLTDKIAVARWEYEADILHNCGVLTIADQGVLESRCYLYGEIVQLQKDIKEEGRTIKREVYNKEGGIATIKEGTNPKVAQLIQYLKEYRLHGSLLGLDPSSRAKLQVKDIGDDTDEFKEFE